jgi:hypothetical protein
MGKLAGGGAKNRQIETKAVARESLSALDFKPGHAIMAGDKRL